jgi:hypothetical protein
VLAPERIDEKLRRDDLVRAQEENGEDRTLSRSSERIGVPSSVVASSGPRT